MGADGILLGTFGTGAFFLAYLLWQERRRLSLWPDRPLLRRMLRFGLPTMPAELTLYSLNFIDRIIIVRLAGLAEAGLYALAVKFANGLQVLARGFQLAFPPLAYSIRDDDEARRVYALLVTWFAAVLAFAVTGLWLEARWIVRLLAADEFFASLRGDRPARRRASPSTRSTWRWSSCSAAPAGPSSASRPRRRRWSSTWCST